MPNLTQGYTVQTNHVLLISLKYLTIRGEEERGQGAECSGEEERLLSNRKFKVISNSPLLPAPRSPAPLRFYPTSICLNQVNQFLNSLGFWDFFNFFSATI